MDAAAARRTGSPLALGTFLTVGRPDETPPEPTTVEAWIRRP